MADKRANALRNRAKSELEEVEVSVRAIFEECREIPAGPFENQDFMRFLVDQHADSSENTWAGANRQANFLFGIEQHFLICFPYKEAELAWNFDAFCEWVAIRKAKTKVNLNLAVKHRDHYVSFGVPLLLWVMLIPLSLWHGKFLVAICIAIGASTILIVWFAFSSYRHYARLVRKLRRLL